MTALSTIPRDTRPLGDVPVPAQVAYPVAAGVKCIQGGIAAMAISGGTAGYVKPAIAATNLVCVGRFDENFDNSTGSAGGVSTDSPPGRTVCRVTSGAFWYDNSSSGDAIAQANVMGLCYLVDDATVALTDGSGARSIAGIVLAVDATKGVLVLMGPVVGDVLALIASTYSGILASAISITDSAGRITATTIEGALAELAGRYVGTVADLTALKAIGATARADGMSAILASDDSLWRFSSSSALTGDDLLVAAPAAGTGRWLRVDKSVDLKLSVAFGTANNAVLYTVPAGYVLRVNTPFWEVAADFTGGSSSAIGVSSSSAKAGTAGDLLGGASGDVGATLVASAVYAGTVGAKVGAPNLVLVGGDTIKFNRITSAFTAGSGFVHVPVTRLS